MSAKNGKEPPRPGVPWDEPPPKTPGVGAGPGATRAAARGPGAGVAPMAAGNGDPSGRPPPRLQGRCAAAPLPSGDEAVWRGGRAAARLRRLQAAGSADRVLL